MALTQMIVQQVHASLHGLSLQLAALRDDSRRPLVCQYVYYSRALLSRLLLLVSLMRGKHDDAF